MLEGGLLLFILCFNIFLLTALLKKRPYSWLTFSIIWFNTSLALWQTSLIIINFIVDADILHRFAFILASWTLFGAMMIALLYPNKKARTRFYLITGLVGFVNVLATVLILLTNNVIQGYIVKTATVVFAQAGNLFLVFLVLTLLLAIGILTLRYIRERDNRFYFKYVLLSLAGYGVVALFFNFIFPYTGNTKLTVIGSLAAAIPELVIVYSITSYRLYKINFLISKIGLILVRAVMYYLLFYVIAYIETTLWGGVFTLTSLIVGGIIAVLVAILLNYFEKTIRKYFEENIAYGNYSPSKVKDEYSLQVSTELDVDQLLNKTRDLINKIFVPEELALAIIDKESKVLLTQNNQNISETEVLNLIDLLTKLNSSKTILISELKNLGDVNDIVKIFTDKRIEILVPLDGSGKIKGFCIVGRKSSKEPYTLEDINLLESISSVFSIAVDRALLYKEVESFNQSLQFKIKEATKEITQQRDEISEQLRKEKDMMDILGHELRTPLSIARNAISLIEMKLKSDQSPTLPRNLFEGNIAQAMENLRREVKILETVLSSTKIENNRIQLVITDVDCIDVVNDAIDGLKEQAKIKGLELKAEVPQTPLTCKGDRDRIQEIMFNLVDNAVKYTVKGSVTVKVEDLGKEVRFSVADTGEGIPKEDIPKLGKKFFRSRMYLESSTAAAPVVRPGGTGIGLYVVFGLVDLMKGKMEIESEVDKGSIFKVYLPK